MASSIIQVIHLSTKFGDQVIHKDLSFDIIKGEILGIIGGSGSGKSVLLNFLIGLKKPQKGKIIYHTEPPAPDKQIGVMFQAGALISSLTVLENILIPLCEVAKLSKELATKIAYFKLKQVGLELDTALKTPSQLSGGMIKRVALARALALDPEILFLDEPTAGLDPIAAADFDQSLLDLQKHFKMTVVMITHDLDTIATVCDSVAVLVDKKVIAGPVEQVAKYDHPWIQNYFHGPRGKRLFSKKEE